MDSCAGTNHINAKRRTYSGENYGKSSVNKAYRGTAVSRVDTIRPKYRVSEKEAVIINTKELQTNNKGIYCYVEHCGVKQTFVDAVKTQRVHKKEKSCFDKVVMIILFAVLLFFLAGSYCEYLDAFNDIKNTESQIAKCREEQTKYLMAIEQRDDFSQIESYAIEKLGMVKSEKLTRHFVNISGKDVVTINDTEQENVVAQGVLLSGFRSIISNLAN